jgi:hypothetical protein
MTRFFRRFVGALVLDAGAFEDIERDHRAGMQSVVIVMAVCAAAGVGALGLGAGVSGFVTGAVLVLGAWLVWAAAVVTFGTIAMPERETSSNLPELLRVLGFAAAPGVFIAFAALRPAAPVVIVIVAVWMIAAAVTAVRQALDYRSTVRAVAVCIAAWAMSFGVLALASIFLTRRVS